MPAFGFLLILIGIFILINVFNGNLTKLAMGELTFNFSPLGGAIPKPTATPTASSGGGGGGNVNLQP